MDSTQQNPTPKKRPRWARAFLSALSESGNIRLSCDAAGINRWTAYDLRSSDAEFADEWQHALDDAADLLEVEARRRAEHGVSRLKFHQGKAVLVPALDDNGLVITDDKGEPKWRPYVEHEYSDALLMFLLKGARPEKYRENMKVEQSGGLTVRVEYADLDTEAPEAA